MSGQTRERGPGEPPPESLLAAARLRQPHGLRGEFHAELLTPPVIDFEAAFLGREFWLRRGGRLLGRAALAAVRPHQDHYLIGLEGVDGRDAAEALAGAELCLPRAELPPLPEGWFWEEDLIGLEVVDARRGPIGRVAGLDASSPQAGLRIAKPGGGDFAAPWAKALFPKMDLAARRIESDLPLDFPGLDG